MEAVFLGAYGRVLTGRQKNDGGVKKYKQEESEMQRVTD